MWAKLVLFLELVASRQGFITIQGLNGNIYVYLRENTPYHTAMSQQTIIIAGGAGFMGKSLAYYFQQETNYKIKILSRQNRTEENGIEYLQWDGETLSEWKEVLEGALMLINLAGRTVNCRYNEENKRQILESRLLSTQILGEAIQQCQNPPQLWVNVASATIYRHAEDRAMDEATGEIGKGFSVNVCLEWEKAFNAVATPQTRKIALRVAMVLGKKGGVMLAGKQGSGKQYVSWIHEYDFYRLLRFLEKHETLQGTFNASSPNPVPNKDFLRLLRKQLGVWFGLPQPVWLVKFGAWLIGTEAELVLKSRRVVPKALQDLGFTFRYPIVDSAFAEIYGRE